MAVPPAPLAVMLPELSPAQLVPVVVPVTVKTAGSVKVVCSSTVHPLLSVTVML